MKRKKVAKLYPVEYERLDEMLFILGEYGWKWCVSDWDTVFVITTKGEYLATPVLTRKSNSVSLDG